MKHQLPTLPFASDALAPVISAETLSFHHGKHHQGYINNLNALIESTEYADLSLDAIIERARTQNNTAIFNNAAQHWNHAFYWQCLRPAQNDNQPTGTLANAIIQQWSSFEAFQAAFEKSALSQFGSGWTWLIRRPAGDLHIVSTSNAGMPTEGHPLLIVDVWEHAYYIDHRNNRGAYLKALWSIINWTFAESRFTA